MRRRLLGGCTLLAVLTGAMLAGAQEPADPSPAEAPQMNDAEKKFQQTLSGATLIGRYTEGDEAAPKQDRYTIKSLTKLSDKLWLFQARIQYGEHDITLPLPLRVEWAGATPVITLDNVPAPPLGVFSARVLIFDDQYAGVWSGGDHGGQLFGRIQKEKDAP